MSELSRPAEQAVDAERLAALEQRGSPRRREIRRIAVLEHRVASDRFENLDVPPAQCASVDADLLRADAAGERRVPPALLRAQLARQGRRRIARDRIDVWLVEKREDAGDRLARVAHELLVADQERVCRAVTIAERFP